MTSTQEVSNAACAIEDGNQDPQTFRTILQGLGSSDPKIQRYALDITFSYLSKFSAVTEEVTSALVSVLDIPELQSKAYDILSRFGSAPLSQALPAVLEVIVPRMISQPTLAVPTYHSFLITASDDLISVLFLPLTQSPPSDPSLLPQYESQRELILHEMVAVANSHLWVSQNEVKNEEHSGKDREFLILKAVQKCFLSVVPTESEIIAFFKIILSLPSFGAKKPGVGFCPDSDVPVEPKGAPTEALSLLCCLIDIEELKRPLILVNGQLKLLVNSADTLDLPLDLFLKERLFVASFICLGV
ncbi:hypothetical protein GEMRC1_004424 [Eukaryota sp. GEM-RC1]